MKTLTIIIYFLCISFFSYSQTEAGSTLIGVNTSFRYQSVGFNSPNQTKLVNLFLKGGYFINNNDVLGLTFGLEQIEQSNIDQQMITYGLFGRHYFFGVIFAGVGFTSSKYEDFDAYTTIPFELGYATFIRNVVSVEPSISYAVGVSDNASNAFSFLIGFSIYLN